MRVLDFLKPVLEDFFRFAKEVDKEFLSYVEREELYEGLKKAQELKERQQEPLKKLYCEWMEKSFRFLIDRWVCFEKIPNTSFLLASGLIKMKNKILLAMLSIGKGVEGLTEEELELGKYISEKLRELYIYGFVNSLATLLVFRGDCGNDEIIIPSDAAFVIFEKVSYFPSRDDDLRVIPNVLMLRYLYDKFFDEYHSTFTRILSERLSQAIQEGYPERRIRLIQTAIAVIKGDPKSLPEGEPKSFVEKWLREELRV
jgi:hypothetical protein